MHAEKPWMFMQTRANGTLLIRGPIPVSGLQWPGRNGGRQYDQSSSSNSRRGMRIDAGRSRLAGAEFAGAGHAAAGGTDAGARAADAGAACAGDAAATVAAAASLTAAGASGAGFADAGIHGA